MADYVTTAYVAAELNVSEETVRQYVRDGVIPVLSRTRGGHSRYDLASVRTALDLQPRIRRLRPLDDGEVRLGDAGRGIIEGSLADDFQITAADVGRGDAAELPTWPGRPGSTRVIGGRPVLEA